MLPYLEECTIISVWKEWKKITIQFKLIGKLLLEMV